MSTITLAAEVRSKEQKAAAIRREGKVPCVLYGHNTENTSLSCEKNAILKAYKQAGESTLVELDFDKKKVPVLIHTISLDGLTSEIDHVDFFAVDMNTEVQTHVPIHFTGESRAVKDFNGVIVTALDHVTVRCLPANLPREFIVDISKLEEFSDMITVGDLTIPEKVTVLEAEDMVIATVQEPRESKVASTSEEGEDGEAKEGDAAEEKKEDTEKKE